MVDMLFLKVKIMNLFQDFFLQTQSVTVHILKKMVLMMKMIYL